MYYMDDWEAGAFKLGPRWRWFWLGVLIFVLVVLLGIVMQIITTKGS